MKNRFYLIDGLRGLAVVNMVAYHFLYDVFNVYGFRPGWHWIPSVHIWQQFICRTFILVSGFVWLYGYKKNLKRGLMLNFWGLVITAVTAIVEPSEIIWFGILNFLGCSVLLMFPLRKLADKIPPVVGIVVTYLLFVMCKPLESYMFGIPGLFTVNVPSVLYCPLLTPFGFPFPEFYSSDYFAIFPWFFLYLCGYHIGRLFDNTPSLHPAASVKVPVLTAIGQKSIWIYLVHQPLCMALCVLLFDVLKIGM